MNQKDVFLNSEGDAWFKRNHKNSLNRDFDKVDSVVSAVKNIIDSASFKENRLNILEIGCGGGKRLEWMKSNLNVDVYGIDPSLDAINQAVRYGINAKKGTADSIPFSSGFFDIVIFGFCLYLCDKDDFFKISSEANRVLKSKSWLVIQDFFSISENVKEYGHKEGVYVRKMDYRSLFTWHPDYVCFHHAVYQHLSTQFIDDKNEWVSTSVIRKEVKSV
jgi:ubiquinone/menaquinone biosynthesis C-methylase UbiE